MPLRINGEILNNLQEQVQYLTDYHNENKAIAAWGIKVVGQVATAEELPDEATYKGEYGDTYAVGTEAPFFFYIWTRSSIAGEEQGYWFPFGDISIVGPQGPIGPQGPQGPTGESSKWYAATNTLINDPTIYKEGDMYINVGTSTSKGHIYRFNGTNWIFLTTIIGPQGLRGPQGNPGKTGPQGPQGPKGDTGDVGGFINIWGILTSEAQLPTPSSLNNLTVAYLVTHEEHNDLYIQVGSTSETATWNNVGPFNAATLVTVGGSGQNVWNADTKLNKPSEIISNNDVVLVSLDGNTHTRALSLTAVQGKIPSYGGATGSGTADGAGYLTTGTPVQNYHAATKKYVDDAIARAGGGSKLYKHDAYLNKDGLSMSIQVISSSNTPIDNILDFCANCNGATFKSGTFKDEDFIDYAIVYAHASGAGFIDYLYVNQVNGEYGGYVYYSDVSGATVSDNVSEL